MRILLTDGSGLTARQCATLLDIARSRPVSLAVLTAASAATLARPCAWSWFATGSVTAYALTPAGWQRIRNTDPGSQT